MRGQVGMDLVVNNSRQVDGELATHSVVKSPPTPSERRGSPDPPRRRPKFVPGPRLLTLGELERVRDDLAAQLSTAHARATKAAAHHAQAHAGLERMLADPPAHKWRRLSNADLGRPGCTTYHVRPKAGVLGLLMGWWEVKVSGGCP